MVRFVPVALPTTLKITLDFPDSLAQTDTFNEADWMREIAISTIRPVMDALIDRAGFRVSSQLYQQVLNRSNEA